MELYEIIEDLGFYWMPTPSSTKIQFRCERSACLYVDFGNLHPMITEVFGLNRLYVVTRYARNTRGQS